MQAPENMGSSAARMIVAITVFVAACAAVVVLMLRSPDQPADISHVSPVAPPAAGAPQSGSEFFYDSIGQGERLEEKATAGDGRASYTLEIKVANSKEEAEKTIDSLRGLGVEAYYTPLARQGKVVYRVRRGIFTNQKEATRAAVALKEERKVAASVVKLQ